MGLESPILCQKRSGAYFTPGDLAGALVAWAVRSASDRLLDPSCGDGQFLSAHRKSVGIEQNPHSAQAAISAAPWALVHEGDFFAWALETRERFECAAGNPPFIRYQSFNGEIRRRALDVCARVGAELPVLLPLGRIFGGDGEPSETGRSDGVRRAGGDWPRALRGAVA